MDTPDWFPSTSSWVGWSTPAIPEGLTTAVQTVGTLTGAVTSSLSIVKTALTALSAVQLARVDLTQVAVAAAVTAIDAALASLESDTGVYLLLVPPKRRVVIPQVVQATMDAVGMSSIPAGPVNMGIIELQTLIAKDGVDREVESFLRQSISATGGSEGFMRTVLESLTDEADNNRPQLARTDFVAGGILISGAPDYASILSFLMAVDSLVGVGPGRQVSALNAPDIPTPQDLKVQRLSVGAQLSWKAQPAVVTVPALGSVFVITEVAVIRATDPSTLMARTPMDLFGTTSLTVGLKKGDAEVIKLRDGIASLTTYLDDAVSPSPEPYYYTLAYHLEDLEGNDKGYGPLSNVVKYTHAAAQASTRSGHSVPPDWVRFPRAIDLIPGMAKVFDFIRHAGISFQGASLGEGDALKAYVKFLAQLIEYYGSYVDTAGKAVEQLSALAGQKFTAGAGLYSFAGVGGTPYLARAVAEGTSKLGFGATDFVGGAVIAVAGPSHAVVAPVWAIISALLGTADAESSIMASALAGLNDQLGIIEAAILGDDFKPGTPSSTSSAPLTADCDPAPPTLPTLGDDFKP